MTVLSGSVNASAATASAPAGVIDVSSISEYVYPGNAPATPGAMQFMPDGTTFLRLDDGGKKS